MPNTRPTWNGIQIEVEVNGKMEWREAYVETKTRERGVWAMEWFNRVKPVLRSGEMLMETIEGRVMIVQGKV